MNRPMRIHPLDKLINDDSLFLLEAMVPFVDYQYKLPLIFYIKYRELTMIMQSLNDRAYISECGFDCHPKSSEEMLGSICSILPGDYANTFKQMKQMMQMMEVMNSMPKPPPEPPCENHFTEPCEDRFTGFSENHNGSQNLYDSVMSILNERE